jgi:hypothetical protein
VGDFQVCAEGHSIIREWIRECTVLMSKEKSTRRTLRYGFMMTMYLRG